MNNTNTTKTTARKATTRKATAKATPAEVIGAEAATVALIEAAAKPAPTKPAGPVFKTAAEAAAISPATHLKADQAVRVGTPAGPVAPGYIVRWPKNGYDLLLRTADAEGDGSKWLVRCNLHQTTTPAAGTADGDRQGRKAERDVWCSGCAGAVKATVKATAKSTAKSTAKRAAKA